MWGLRGAPCPCCNVSEMFSLAGVTLLMQKALETLQDVVLLDMLSYCQPA